MALNKVEICGVNTSKLPLLTSEEKDALFARILKGDQNAREEYIKGNLRLVLSVIQRFSSSNENVDDLFQIGCIGLIKAIDNFDVTQNVKFSTYAVPMILGEVRRYLRDNNSIRVSRSLLCEGCPDKEKPAGTDDHGNRRRGRDQQGGNHLRDGRDPNSGKPL